VYASGGVSKEEYELRKASLESNRASVEAGKANIAANEANVRNLSAMQEFKKVFAPFAGTITERQVEIGALVSSGSITGNMPLFHLADSRTLRVFVNVPQMLAPTVFNDQPADVSVDQFPNQLFKGRIVRSSGAVDASTRTMLTEVHIPNDEHKLMPGIFVGVKLRFHRTIPPVIIPAAALVMRSHGAFVALIQPGDKVHFQPVVVGRDLGTAIELSSGVNEGDRLGMNVGEDILEGQVITPVPYVPSTPNQPAQPKVAANN
jgi:RND family efflux transporter MFP subunit